MNINKSPRRIKRDAGGRNKNPVAKLLRTPMYKPQVKKRGMLRMKSYFFNTTEFSICFKGIFQYFFNK